MILESVENGPLIWPMIDENGVTRTKKYAELSATEKIQADCDMKATNIILHTTILRFNNRFHHLSFAVPVFSLRDDPIACLNKAMAFLTAVASSSSATSSRGNNASGQVRVVKCYNCQGEGHMARQCTQPKRPRNATWYKDKAMLAEAQEAGQILDEEQLTFLADPGSDYDDISNAKAVLMANISNYGFDVISEVPHSETYLNDMENQETQQANVQDTNLQAQQDSMILSVIEQMSEQMINHKAQRIKPNLYDGIVISAKHVVMLVIDDEETLILEEESRSKMSEKGKDLEFRISNSTIESSNQPPVKVEVPSELPKVSLVSASLKKLKFHLAQFDSVVKKRTTPDAHTKGKWGFERTKAVFNNEIIPFLKSLKVIFNVFDKDLLNEIMEVQTVFEQMDTVVQ
ncbi:integrase, catalytic region, zinc finger, CCHC-type containing protein [Tanacetum coccineum]